jgi:enamine deaminase RidA (YjgF/YER057c/UK114 family)
MTQQTTFPSANALVEHINPDRLRKNPAFTQVISVSGPVKTIYVCGQDAFNAQGTIVGKGDLKAQTAQVLAHLREALATAGAGPEHIITWNMYLVQGQLLQKGFEAFQQFWGLRPNPPTITMAYVSGLANPDFLIEMDAVAVVPLA